MFHMVRFLFLTLAATVAAYSQTRAEAEAFLKDAETKLLKVGNEAQRASWIQSTYITEDTEALTADANEAAINVTKQLARGAVRFDKLNLPPDMKRKLYLLKNALTVATPTDAKESSELTKLMSGMEGTYGRGKYCRDNPKDNGKCLDISSIETILAESRETVAAT